MADFLEALGEGFHTLFHLDEATPDGATGMTFLAAFLLVLGGVVLFSITWKVLYALPLVKRFHRWAEKSALAKALATVLILAGAAWMVTYFLTDFALPFPQLGWWNLAGALFVELVGLLLGVPSGLTRTGSDAHQ